MPLANNSTGASTGEDYNYSNPATIAGILSPTDGDVYTYGYDDSRKQFVIKKVRKTAQVPHKGMTAHPVYTNNLLSTYQKNAVVPTMTDYLSSYVKQAAVPVAGTQQPTLTWGDPNRFKQALQNMSGDLRRGALHGVAGTQQTSVTWATPAEFKQQLTNISGTPMSGALHGLNSGMLASYGWSEEQKKRFKQTLNNISGSPLTGALHGLKSGMLASYGWSEEQKKRFRQTLDNMSVKPPSGALHGVVGVGGKGGFTFTNGKFKTDRTKQIEDLRLINKPIGALYGKSGAGSMGGFTFANGKFKTDRTKLIEDLRLINKPLGALFGRQGIGGSVINGRFETTSTTQFRELRKMATFKPAGALHGLAGTQQARYSWESPERFKQQLKNMSGNTKTGALHGKAAPGGATGNILGALTEMLGFGGSSWPIAKFHFYVMIGGTELGFQSVEGLEAKVGVIEYRDGNAPFFGKEKVPGMISYENITLKKGMFSNDTNANSWFKEIAQDRQYTKRRTIIIAMMDNNLIPQFIWRYEQCFITKIVPSGLDAEAETEVAIEELEFVGRAWYTETLAGAALGALGSISGAF